MQRATVCSYIIEKREGGAGSEWSACAQSRFTYLTVEGLQHGKTYEIRIKAENKHGISEPCAPTTPFEIPVARVRRKNYDGERRHNADSALIAPLVVDEVGRHVRGRGSAASNYDTYGEARSDAFGL